MNTIVQTELPNGIWISTVMLTLFVGDYAFETMVFPWKGNYDEITVRRYDSLKDAKEGHKQLCEEYKDKPPFDKVKGYECEF
jgi:hypothetical protein